VAAPLGKQIEEQTDTISFLFWQLGMGKTDEAN
jgi:hypothetical protein